MKRLLFALCLLAFTVGACTQPVANSNINQRINHYTVVVSLDGFRWDYPNLYNTPTLDEMARRGVSATMLPSFPASTFPNHYTLATGLVPDHHGIVNNQFWDSKSQRRYSMTDNDTRYDPYFYLGEPIWITAQKQGVITGNLYWVGSDIPHDGMYPTYYKVWDNLPRLTYAQRVETALAWLNKPEAERPRLIMLYIDQPDAAGHNFGPNSEETGKIVESLDDLMGVLVEGIANLPFANRVNLIVTSDHGMTDISVDRVVNPFHYIKSSWYERMEGSTPTTIFCKPGYRETVYNALKDVEHISVWKKEEIPAELNYGTSDRIGDIVVAPELGWQFSSSARDSKGAHGYFPQSTDMQVMFRAYGPDFKQGYTSTKFVNVDIYPLLAYLLGITPVSTDGRFERVKEMVVE